MALLLVLLAAKALDQWHALVQSLKQMSLHAFVNMLQRYREKILNHYDYPIHTGTLEGVNNRIKASNARPTASMTCCTLH